ncbi:hypothetical protein [Mesorhizobium sp. NZP2298]|uniref:hypothetical protein n=1 Tax=Mesorhizobium sp. NZP2298 TaxID=2483403 RepID=UPI0015531D91|nr:hypothetical protein [Mesorhizobium sp. NZP2298]
MSETSVDGVLASKGRSASSAGETAISTARSGPLSVTSIPVSRVTFINSPNRSTMKG